MRDVMNKTVIFSEVEIKKLFGDLAAEDDPQNRFKSYFFKSDTYIKIHNQLPLRVLVAHKGIGKSAVFRMSYLDNIENNILSLWIKPDGIADLRERV